MKKKSIGKKVWIPVLAVLVVAALVAGVLLRKPKADVRYLLPDGTEFVPEKATNGGDIRVPDNPQMPEGWIFTGWSFSNEADPAQASDAPEEGAGNQNGDSADALDLKSTVYAKANAVHVPVFDTGLALTSGYGTKGNRVTLPLQICGEVNVCAFEAEIHYDPSQLKFVEFANKDPGVVINAIEDEGLIVLNYMDSANTVGDVSLADLVFEIVGESDTVTPLTVTVTNGTRLNDENAMEDVDITIISAAVQIVKG